MRFLFYFTSPAEGRGGRTLVELAGAALGGGHSAVLIASSEGKDLLLKGTENEEALAGLISKGLRAYTTGAEGVLIEGAKAVAMEKLDGLARDSDIWLNL